MAFKMRGMSFVQGQSPMKKIGGKNYEKSKGDQQGPIPKNNIKLQPSENPDTYAYKEGDINPYYLKDKTKFVEGQRINDLEERKSFIEEDEFNSDKSTKQQKKDKKWNVHKKFWYIVDNECLYVFNICPFNMLYNIHIPNPHSYSISICVEHMPILLLNLEYPHHSSRTLYLPSQEPQYSICCENSS